MGFGKKNLVASKLNSYEVQQIRREYETAAVTQGMLARKYGISTVQIGRIVRGESWAGGNRERRAGGVQPLGGEAQHTAADDSAVIAESAARMLALQEAMRAGKPPVSPLDGGDGAEETGGAGHAALIARAAELGGKPK